MKTPIRQWWNIIKIQPLLLGLVLVLGACQTGGETDMASTEEPSGTEPMDEPMDESSGEAIFNGVDLTDWDGDARFWSVQDGAIVGETTAETPTEANTFLIWEGGEPANFEATFRFRFVIVSDDSSGNSGLQFRSERFTDEENPNLAYRVRGPQADMAISDWIPGIHYEEQGRGIQARRGQRVHIAADGERHEERFAEEADLGQYINVHTEWNTYRVYANGDTMRTWINDQLMHELIDESAEARSEGILAFQLHAGPPMRVELRDIMLNTLPSP